MDQLAYPTFGGRIKPSYLTRPKSSVTETTCYQITFSTDSSEGTATKLAGDGTVAWDTKAAIGTTGYVYTVTWTFPATLGDANYHLLITGADTAAATYGASTFASSKGATSVKLNYVRTDSDEDPAVDPHITAIAWIAT